MAEQSPLEPETSREAKSFGASQLIARIFDQLSVSVWLPATFLVSGVYFVAAYASLDIHTPNLFARVNAAFNLMAARSASGFLLGISSVIAITVVVQAFEVEAVRLLSGDSSPISPLGRFLANAQCAYHRWSRRKLLRKLLRFETKAFDSACNRICSGFAATEAIIELQKRSACLHLDLSVDDALALNRRKLKVELALRKQSAGADAVEWQKFAPPAEIRNIESCRQKLLYYPSNTASVTPTRIGNLMVASQERICNLEGFDEADINSLMIRHSGSVTREAQQLYRIYQQRLHLYCVLTLMAITGTVLSTVIFLYFRGLASAAAVGMVGICLMVTAYRAAFFSAVDYTRATEEIAKQIQIVNLNVATDAEPQPSLRGRVADLIGGNRKGK